GKDFGGWEEAASAPRRRAPYLGREAAKLARSFRRHLPAANRGDLDLLVRCVVRWFWHHNLAADHPAHGLQIAAAGGAAIRVYRQYRGRGRGPDHHVPGRPHRPAAGLRPSLPLRFVPVVSLWAVGR